MALVLASIVGAIGSVITAYVSVKVRSIAQTVDGRMTELIDENKLLRAVVVSTIVAETAGAAGASRPEPRQLGPAPTS